MIVPWQEIESETLTNLIETFVLREGTDYGEVEFSLKEKVDQIKNQLKNNEIDIVYNDEDKSFNFIMKNKF